MLFEFFTPSYSVPGRDVPLLAPSTFSLEGGTIACLMGPSGVGKSTFLKLVSGIEPDSGARVKRGHSQEMPCHLAGFGYIPQTPLLLPWKTVKENVALATSGQGPGALEVTTCLDWLGLLPAQNLYPFQLSQGMASRTAFARELVKGAQVIFMDEPFAAWDPEVKALAFDTLKSLVARLNMCVLFATHSGYEATTLSHKLFVLSGKPAHLNFIASRSEGEAWDHQHLSMSVLT